jgi:formate-dependent nitrite reductase membrane component NrfD
VLAIGAAIYTGYLFSQAEGRDLWQSSLLPTHLVIQAVMVGSGTLLIIGLFISNPPQGLIDTAWIAFVVALILDLFVTLIGEFSVPHASEVAVRAAHEISHGDYKNYFWWGSIALGHALPLLLAIVTAAVTEEPIIGAFAGLCAIAGLYLFEYAFVMAPQEIPNS